MGVRFPSEKGGGRVCKGRSVGGLGGGEIGGTGAGSVMVCVCTRVCLRVACVSGREGVQEIVSCVVSKLNRFPQNIDMWIPFSLGIQRLV